MKIEINLPKGDLRETSRNLLFYQRHRLDKLIQGEIESTIKHFSKDKWNLNYSHIQDNIIGDFFGGDISRYIMGEILHSNKNLQIVCTDKGFMIVDKTYQVVYYNTESNSIFLPDMSKYTFLTFHDNPKFIQLEHL